MSPFITTRNRGEIPGCISPAKQTTFCESLNIDVNVKDVAEHYAQACQAYIDGILPYETWWRITWNYGKIIGMR